MLRVVMFSGGIGSWAAAKRVAAQHGTDDLTLLFADTLIEDEDSYRFLAEAAANVGGRLVRIADGRTPWQVFRDRRFIGNTRIDPCSLHLKREVCDRWLADNCDPASTTVYLGIDWTEEHRFTSAAARLISLGWGAEAPLIAAPFLGKRQMLALAVAEGLTPPRLYAMGFPHGNCGGFCVKAGQGHFAILLREMPARFREHEAEEQATREFLGKDISILRDRRGGGTKPLTLREFRERREAGGQVDLFDLGGCGCFAGEDERESAAAMPGTRSRSRTDLLPSKPK